MKIASCTSGDDPSLIINDNPKVAWASDLPTAEIVIELESVQNLCAIGYWPHEISRDNPDISEAQFGARFLSGYEFYVSCDGVSYELAGKGTMLCHGGEQRVRFNSTPARFVKLKLLSSAGSASHKPHYADTPVMLGEIDVYTSI